MNKKKILQTCDRKRKAILIYFFPFNLGNYKKRQYFILLFNPKFEKYASIGKTITQHFIQIIMESIYFLFYPLFYFISF